MSKLVHLRVGGLSNGTQVMNDRFAVDGWGNTGEAPGNSITFWPDKHDLQTNLGFEVSSEMHEALRIALWLETVGEKQRLLKLING